MTSSGYCRAASHFGGGNVRLLWALRVLGASQPHSTCWYSCSLDFNLWECVQWQHIYNAVCTRLTTSGTNRLPPAPCCAGSVFCLLLFQSVFFLLDYTAHCFEMSHLLKHIPLERHVEGECFWGSHLRCKLSVGTNSGHPTPMQASGLSQHGQFPTRNTYENLETIARNWIWGTQVPVWGNIFQLSLKPKLFLLPGWPLRQNLYLYLCKHLWTWGTLLGQELATAAQGGPHAE